MWKPYLNVIAEKLGQAVHVLDRFHVMQQFVCVRRTTSHLGAQPRDPGH
jgi:transposase